MSYIDNWFHFYSTTESFEVHRKQGLINSDSICFLKETGQIYTQNSFFGICRERYEKLEQLVLNHDAKIKDILGIEGPSVKDGVVNNIADLVNFLDGFTDEDNLKDFLDAMRASLEAQINAVSKALSDRITTLEDVILNDSGSLHNTLDLIKSQIETIDVRLDNHDTAISALNASLASHIREYNLLRSNYENFKSYTETKFTTIDSSISSINISISTLQREFTELDEKFDDVENEIAEVGSLLEDAKQLVRELEDRFGETLAAFEQFKRDINEQMDDFRALVGAPNGIAPLDGDAKVPAAYLPSYVDDVLEYATKTSFPVIGESGKIYVALDTNIQYRWSGTQYTELSKSLGLGEISSTAYPGNKGKKNADDIAAHKIDYNNPHRVTKSQVGLDRVDNTRDIDKPISTAVQKALNDKVQIEPGKGLISLEETNKIAETNAKVTQFEEELQSEINRATTAEGAINAALATHKADAAMHLTRGERELISNLGSNGSSSLQVGDVSIEDTDELPIQPSDSVGAALLKLQKGLEDSSKKIIYLDNTDESLRAIGDIIKAYEHISDNTERCAEINNRYTFINKIPPTNTEIVDPIMYQYPCIVTQIIYKTIEQGEVIDKIYFKSNLVNTYYIVIYSAKLSHEDAFSPFEVSYIDALSAVREDIQILQEACRDKVDKEEGKSLISNSLIDKLESTNVIKKLTQAEYDAITEKDQNTIYYITDYTPRLWYEGS